LNLSAKSISKPPGASGKAAAPYIAAVLACFAVLAATPCPAQDASAQTRSNRPIMPYVQASPSDRPAKPFVPTPKNAPQPVAAKPAAKPVAKGVAKPVAAKPASKPAPDLAAKPAPAPFVPRPAPKPLAAALPKPAPAGESSLNADRPQALERIRLLEIGLAERERGLARLERERGLAVAEAEAVRAEKDRVGEQAYQLARLTWPVAAERLADATLRRASWDEEDRTFWWLAAASGRAAASRQAFAEQAARLAGARERLGAIDEEAARQRERVKQARGELAGERGALIARAAALRGESFDLGLELSGLAVAGQAGPLSAEASRLSGLDGLRGKLRWPVAGELSQAKPPGLGIGFAARAGTAVTAVHPGVVVFAGAVAGYGDVVVLDHGRGYVSVYAFLESARAERGRRVEAGEPLGEAGSYAPGEGHGVYFALRFHEKAINPGMWLAAGP
jgi:murein hydrolase activator